MDLLKLGRDAESDAAGASAQRERVREWTRECLGLEDDVTISVNELVCREPGCPPTEVVVAVFRPGRPIQQCRVHAGLAELDRERVCRAWRADAPPHPAPDTPGEHRHD